MLFTENQTSLQVKEYTLSNGLTVWLNEDHNQPKVFGAIVVKAGAKDCPDTGIAHYFEHMMFKGTDKIGTTDYASEKAILDLIADKYDALADSDNDETRLHLQKIINELSVRASEYIIPNEFDRLVSRYGGTKLNAGTSYDSTLYFNTFAPQYIAQWAELNSERLLNPVFRLFQNELETVYEEKNMYNDMIGGRAIEKLTERYFQPHPYAHPIIGSTKNLKNPRLSEMRIFFETYYVASNMGLILSGDIDAETTLPILEASFARIRRGEAPHRKPVALPPFVGREKVQIKISIPFFKIMALGFRGVPAHHDDQAALNIAVSLLNNSNSTGYLDMLMVNHKVIASMALNQSLNEAGMLGIFVIPKILFHTYASTERRIWKEINRIKEGDFTDDVFKSLQLEQLREYKTKLEDIDSRAQIMMDVFSQGKCWADYLNEISRIQALTKNDVIQIACKYFSDNYLYVTKKTGTYPKEYLPKPDYTPVTPKNKEAVSAYAKELEKMPVRDIATHLVDFEQDVQTIRFHDLARLYVTPNPVNDIFMLNLSYGIGLIEQPALTQLVDYLHLIGTDSMTFEKFHQQLQLIGSTLSFEVNDTDFTVRIVGFDAYLDETLTLVSEFMYHAKADTKKIRQLVDDVKITEKAFVKSSDSMAEALLEKVKYGDKSHFLSQLSLSRVKKLKAKELIGLFNRVQQWECNLHYCGKLPVEEVERQIRKHLALVEMDIDSASPLHRELREYDKSMVYFLDMPELSQSIVYTYVRGEVPENISSLYASKLFAGYFGGDMSSLMFQEIREFRSYAYQVNAKYTQPRLNHMDKAGGFVTQLSTQSDKTVDALTVLDSLMREMPLHPERMEAIRQNIRNKVNNEYPSFRELSSHIATLQREGYETDPNIDYLKAIQSMDMEEISRFYASNVQGRPIVYAIVGNAQKVDMKKLDTFGTLVMLKKKDIYK